MQLSPGSLDLCTLQVTRWLILMNMNSCQIGNMLSGKDSCETQLTTVINDWAKILDNRGQVDTFILDFEKAFDTPLMNSLKANCLAMELVARH